MQFGDPLASGIYLVREALRSPNYVAGTEGWTINADGTAEFNDATFRGDLQSENYVPGVSGWHLDEAGAAEFYSIIARGELSTGTAPNAFVRLFDTGSGYAQIQLSTDDPAQTKSGFLFAAELAGAGNAVYLDSTQVGFGGARIKLIGSQDGVARPQIEFADLETALELLALIYGELNVTGRAEIGANLDVLGNIAGLGYVNTLGEVISGDPTGLHVRHNVNQIRALNGAAASPLYLNWLGGVVNVGTAGIDVNGPVVGNSGNIGSVSLSGGVISAGGSSVGTAFIVAGGQINAAVSPPTTGTAANATWILTGGTNYRLNRFTSSRKYKENIRDLELDCARVLELRPRVFQRNDNRDYKAWRFQSEPEPIVPVTETTPWEVGFIAEEADDLGLSQWVEKQDGEIESFSYQLFVVAQHAVLRSQQKTIETLESRIAKLEAIINALPDGLKR